MGYYEDGTYELNNYGGITPSSSGLCTYGDGTYGWGTYGCVEDISTISSPLPATPHTPALLGSWKFELINSADMSPIAELKRAFGKTVQIVHNRAGLASFNYPINDKDLAHRIVPYKTGIIAKRYNWRESEAQGRSVWDDIWSGYVLPINRDFDNKTMKVDCVGWLNRLERRFLREDVTYPYVASTSTDDGDILLNLLDRMNANPGPDGYYFTPMNDSSFLTLMDSGSKLPNEGAGGATAYVPAYRGMEYTKDQQILQAYIDLMSVENGADITVNPTTRVLDVYRKYMRILPNLKFGYQCYPQNVQSLGQVIESEKTVNYMLVRGSPLSVPRYQDDIDSMAEFGPLEEITTLSDVADVSETNSILQYYASAEVALRAFPPYTFSIKPFVYSPYNSVPEPFVDYRVGDQVYFNGKEGNVLDVKDLAVRVFGFSIQISDATGVEQLQGLQLTPE